MSETAAAIPENQAADRPKKKGLGEALGSSP